MHAKSDGEFFRGISAYHITQPVNRFNGPESSNSIFGWRPGWRPDQCLRSADHRTATWKQVMHMKNGWCILPGICKRNTDVMFMLITASEMRWRHLPWFYYKDSFG